MLVDVLQLGYFFVDHKDEKKYFDGRGFFFHKEITTSPVFLCSSSIFLVFLSEARYVFFFHF